jgi:hypothetical protein
MEKVVKVTCDCCGADIECPEQMMKTSKKHICFSCFQDPEKTKSFTDEEKRNVHVDIPMENMTDMVADDFTQTMVKKTFPDIWSQKKEELKSLSKKDLAEEMFGAGVYLGIQAFMDSFEDIMEQAKLLEGKTKSIQQDLKPLK